MPVTSRVTAVLLGVFLMLAAFPASPAAAEVGCDKSAEYCEISDGGDGGGVPGDKGGGGGGTPQIPLCSSFTRGAPDNPPEPDWIYIECRLSATDGDTIGLWVPPRESAEQLAWLAIARLQLKPIEIGLTPLDPDVMTAVGIPVWLWVDNPTRTSWGPASISAGGISLDAQVESVTWSMGDGTRLSCGRGTRWRPSMVDRDGMVGESPRAGELAARAAGGDVALVLASRER